MAADRDSLLAEDRARALQLTPVSREIAARLDRFVALLLEWQQRMNLIASSTIPQIWTRHIADSLQLLDLAPDAKIWVDLGSGAGFPGLAIACALADVPEPRSIWLKAMAKRPTFLREAARHHWCPGNGACCANRGFREELPGRPDIVAARALAPLHEILALAHPFSKTGAQGLFLKGQDVASELTHAAKYWKFEPILVPSKTSPNSRIVSVGHWEPRRPRH